MAGRPIVGLRPKDSGSGRPVVGLAPKPGDKKKDSGGGLLHILEQTGTDFKNAALQAPGGLVAVGKAAALDFKDTALHPSDHSRKKRLLPIAEGAAKQTAETLKHPLRHPGDTLLTVLPLGHGVARTGEGVTAATRAAKAGEGVKAVVKAAVKPEIGHRTLKVNDLEVRGHYSRAAGSRVVQKGVDKALQKGATKSVRVENALHRRADKWNKRNERVADATARATGTRLSVLGKKLKPAELRALRLVAEEVPVARRLGAQEMRKGRATHAKEQARHQERIDLTKGAMQFLDEHPTTGAPVFKPQATKLAKVYDALKAASNDRAGILKHLDLLDEGAQQAAKTNAARVAAGGKYEKPTAAKLGKASQALKREQARLQSLERRHAETLQKQADFHNAQTPITVAAKSPLRKQIAQARAELSQATTLHDKFVKANPGIKGVPRASNPYRNRVVQLGHSLEALQTREARWAERAAPKTIRASNPHTDRLVRLGHELEAQQARVTQIEKTAASRVKQTGIVGANDITVSAEAPFIGNPVERNRLTGKPKVSSTGTFGHTSKPSSLKKSTGASVEHALERNDVTQIVAERQHEAARLGKIDRVVQKIAKKAGETSPRRKDDVWVWTDKTVSNERIPKEVKQFLDNPESLQSLAPDKQVSIIEKLKEAILQKEDWRDATKVAEFEKLAQDGKGVFVPRRLLGDIAKQEYAGTTTGIGHAADVVNNAQKAALVYLKVNYPIVQGLSNTAMNLIQQGPYAVKNLTTAFRLDGKIGGDYAAIVDDIMGQGAVLQAAFEGQGTVARATQKLAHVMSSKVDTPARRSAFLHEASKAGYKTPERLKSLIDDEANAGDLAEVAQRAKEAIVDYGDLSPFERKVIRKLLFVYPWQKGATKYAGHFLRDHPVQAAALEQAGVIGKQQSDLTFGSLPSYLEGLIPFGDKSVNPAGVNFFQTPAQIGEAVGGLITGDPAQRGAGLGFLAPAPGIVAGLLSGHDDIGRPLQSNVFGNMRDLTYAQAPASALVRAAFGGHDITRKVFGSKTSSQSFPDPHDAYWRFLLGGLAPRKYDKGALNRNAARQKTGR